MGTRVTRWEGLDPPSEAVIEALLREQNLTPRWWSNGAGDRYGRHAHPYRKVLFCARGSIVFHTDSDDVLLQPGDRLDIDPGTGHAATVGPGGVTCVEAEAR